MSREIAQMLGGRTSAAARSGWNDYLKDRDEVQQLGTPPRGPVLTLVPSSFTVREAIKGIDRNRCLKLAAFQRQRRGFRNACGSDGAARDLAAYGLRRRKFGQEQIESRMRSPEGVSTDGQMRIPPPHTRTEICRYVDIATEKGSHPTGRIILTGRNQ